MFTSQQSKLLLRPAHAPRPAAVVTSSSALKTEREAPSTTGVVSYVRPPPGGGDLFRYLYDIPEGKEPTNLERQQEEVTIHNLRSVPAEARPKLRENGIQLVKFKVPSDIDWDNQEEVSARYYPLVHDLLKEVTGATRVHIFDNTVRNGHIRTEEGKKFELEAKGQPVELACFTGMVHVDYTAKGGPLRLERVLPHEAEKLQETPFAVIQVWRPLKGPVQSSPLGIIDTATVGSNDLINYRLHFPDRIGYNYGVQHNPGHRWYYTEEMQADEAYVFVCYESRKGRARFTPHTGFRDLSAKPDAEPRQSIEIRSYCFWENEAPQKPALEL